MKNIGQKEQTTRNKSDHRSKNEPTFTVNDEILETATDCEKDFSCIKGENDNLCTVEDCINGKIHFIKCLNEEYCSYQHSFGDGFFCACPVRKEIFNNYGL